MKKLLIGTAAIFIAAAAWYLLRDTPVTTPVTDSDNLNDLLSGAPVNRVDLTDVVPDTVVIPVANIMSPDIEATEMLESFSSTQAIRFGDYLIVMEFLTDNVAAYSPGGDFVQRIGGDEVLQAASVTANNEYLYIYDYGNKVIHSYNSELAYERSIPFDAPYYTQGSIKINDTHIAYQREDASGFRVGDSGVNELLSIAEIDQPNLPVEELVPRIVPSGKHPGGFNNVLFSINDKSDIVTSYPALPYLFVFRNFKQYRNILLISSAYKEVENPELTPFPPVIGEPVRINDLMDELYLLDNGDIMLFSFGRLYYIQLQRNGEYLHSQSFVMLRGDTGDAIRSVSSIDGLSNDPRTFYIVGSGILFELKLPE